jgi:hypothetical protein
LGQDKSFHHENFLRFVFAANENFEITGYSSFRLRKYRINWSQDTANYDNRDYLENTQFMLCLKELQSPYNHTHFVNKMSMVVRYYLMRICLA